MLLELIAPAYSVKSDLGTPKLNTFENRLNRFLRMTFISYNTMFVVCCSNLWVHIVVLALSSFPLIPSKQLELVGKHGFLSPNLVQIFALPIS